MTTEAPIWPAELFEDLDRNGPIPLYFQVAQRLEDGIRSGVLPPGARLENEISVAKHLNVSRPTVRRAIQEVVDKGLLVRRRGVGTQVVQSHVTRPVELTSFFNDLKTPTWTPKPESSSTASLQQVPPWQINSEFPLVTKSSSSAASAPPETSPWRSWKTTSPQHSTTSPSTN